MKIDLDALAHVVGTKVHIREHKDKRSRRYFVCELVDSEICLGVYGTVYTPAISENHRRWRTPQTARASCARRLRGKRIRFGFLDALHWHKRFNVPDTLTA